MTLYTFSCGLLSTLPTLGLHEYLRFLHYKRIPTYTENMKMFTDSNDITNFIFFSTQCLHHFELPVWKWSILHTRTYSNM